MSDYFTTLRSKGLIKYFFNYHRRVTVKQLPGMPLSQAAIKKKENYLGAIMWKPFMWGPLSRGNFTGDNCLRVIISGQLFYGAIVLALIVRS